MSTSEESDATNGEQGTQETPQKENRSKTKDDTSRGRYSRVPTRMLSGYLADEEGSSQNLMVFSQNSFMSSSQATIDADESQSQAHSLHLDSTIPHDAHPHDSHPHDSHPHDSHPHDSHPHDSQDVGVRHVSKKRKRSHSPKPIALNPVDVETLVGTLSTLGTEKLKQLLLDCIMHVPGTAAFLVKSLSDAVEPSGATTNPGTETATSMATEDK